MNELTTTEDADYSVSPTPQSPLSKPSATSTNLLDLLKARPKLATAMVKAQQSCRPVPHDARNQFHKYDYTSSEAILAEAKDAMASAELALLPVEQSVDGWEREGENRFELVRVFLLMHSSGECVPLFTRWPIIIEKGRPLDKATAAADTLSLAYLLRDLLQMPRVDKEDEVSGRDDRPRQNQTPAPRLRVINESERAELIGLIAEAGGSWEKVRDFLGLSATVPMEALTEPLFLRATNALRNTIAKKNAAPAPPPPLAERQPGDPDPEEIIDEPTRKHLGSLFTGSGWKWADLLAKIGAAPGAKPADLCIRQYEAAVAILSPAKVG